MELFLFLALRMYHIQCPFCLSFLFVCCSFSHLVIQCPPFFRLFCALLFIPQVPFWVVIFQFVFGID
jgi:hypothetical protein